MKVGLLDADESGNKKTDRQTHNIYVLYISMDLGLLNNGAPAVGSKSLGFGRRGDTL